MGALAGRRHRGRIDGPLGPDEQFVHLAHHTPLREIARLIAVEEPPAALQLGAQGVRPPKKRTIGGCRHAVHVGEGPGRLPHLPRVLKVDPGALHEALHQSAAPDAASGAVHVERLGRPPAGRQGAQGRELVAYLIVEPQLTGVVDAKHKASAVASLKDEVGVVLALGQRKHRKLAGPVHAEGTRKRAVSLHEAPCLSKRFRRRRSRIASWLHDALLLSASPPTAFS